MFYGSLATFATLLLSCVSTSIVASTAQDCFQKVEKEEIQITTTYDENGNVVKVEEKTVVVVSMEKVPCK